MPVGERRWLHLVGALAALVLVVGLVLRASVGLSRPIDERMVLIDPRTGTVTTPEIELRASTTDPLFPDVVLQPGESRTACLEIEQHGSVPPGRVVLRVPALGGSVDLARALRVSIDRGAPGAAGDCHDFEPVARVASGTLDDLAALVEAPDVPAWTATDGQRASYRVAVVLSDEIAATLQGTRTTVDLRWMLTAPPAGPPWTSGPGVLFPALLRDVVLPFLWLLVVVVLFLGIQDRIDRRDPKLALAAVVEPPRTFSPPVGRSPAGAVPVPEFALSRGGGR